MVIEDAGDVRGIAMHTPPFPLFLPRLDPQVAERLAHALADAARPLSGVNGERESVLRFADVWLDRTGHVVLYTDPANPVSNSIYQAIGYLPDHYAEQRGFIQ